MAKSEFITIRVDPDEKRKLYQMAGSEFKSLSEFIRDRALEKKDKSHEKKS